VAFYFVFVLIRIKEDIHMVNRLFFSDMTSVGGANGTIQLSAWNEISHYGNLPVTSTTKLSICTRQNKIRKNYDIDAAE